MAYLFVHFTGETQQGEQIYFSLSKDGLHWNDLNKGKPVLLSNIGEKGVRDPYILRSELDGKFYIMATDLRIASGKGWKIASSYGSKKIILWESADLVNWSKPWAYEIEMQDAGCVWAPKAYYDSERNAYLVFWASKVKEKEDKNPKQRIFCCYTKNFKYFTKAGKYLEAENHLIDMTIVKENEIYYRFTKNASTGGIVEEYANDLMTEFTKVESESLRQITGVEGPLCFQMPDGKWCLMVDQFEKKLGYLPMFCDNLKEGCFTVLSPERYNLGDNRKRHGSVLEISEEEYERLYHEYDFK